MGIRYIKNLSINRDRRRHRLDSTTTPSRSIKSEVTNQCKMFKKRRLTRISIKAQNPINFLEVEKACKEGIQYRVLVLTACLASLLQHDIRSFLVIVDDIDPSNS
jgi:hypothetical protein